jgi:hypothetical protein
MYIYYNFLIYSSVVGQLGCLPNLATVNSTAINMGVQVFLLYPNLYSFGYMPKSGITRLNDSSIFSF